MTGLRALLLIAIAQTSCAATSGQEWLNAPVEPPRALLPTSPENAERVSEAPPRLSHTITLGESYSVAAAPAGPALVGGPAVQVNVPVVINNYAGYGAAYGYGGYAVYGRGAYSARGIVAPVRPGGAAQKVGADFPAVPDYGPRAMK